MLLSWLDMISWSCNLASMVSNVALEVIDNRTYYFSGAELFIVRSLCLMTSRIINCVFDLNISESLKQIQPKRLVY
jgi:hypothetical protein